MNCGQDGQALLVPYVLDVLDRTDRLAMEAHLAGCDICAAEARRWGGILAALALSSPVRTPSPSVRRRVLVSLAPVDRAGPPASEEAPGPGGNPKPRLVRRS